MGAIWDWYWSAYGDLVDGRWGSDYGLVDKALAVLISLGWFALTAVVLAFALAVAVVALGFVGRCAKVFVVGFASAFRREPGPSQPTHPSERRTPPLESESLDRQ